MRQSSSDVAGLSQDQFKTFITYVSAACRRMTADQILDVADHLHAMIRRRSARGRSAIAELGRRPSREAASFQDLRQ